jgi:hypothetical protein
MLRGTTVPVPVPVPGYHSQHEMKIINPSLRFSGYPSISKVM